MPWTEDEFIDYGRISGMDPSANWLLGPGAEDFLAVGPDEPIPFLLELKSEQAVRLFARLPPMRENAGGNGALTPRFENEDDSPFRVGVPRMVFATREWFSRLVDPDDDILEAFRTAPKEIRLSNQTPLPNEFIGPDFPTDYVVALPKERTVLKAGDKPPVVTVVIDDGVAFAHDRFRDADGRTRLLGFWNMEPLFGQFLLEPQISSLFAAHPAPGGVEEEALYREAGLLDFADGGHHSAAFRTAHGTHVLDLAAGYPMADDRVDRPIIAVQLPSFVIAATSGVFIDAYVQFAIQGALLMAELLAPGVPVVICSSLGYAAGAHDGSGPLERYVETISGRKLRVVLPSGNVHQSRQHAEISFCVGEDRREVGWRVHPDDLTDSRIQIWMPRGASSSPPAGSRLRVEVTAPGGGTIARDELDAGPVFLPDGNGGASAMIEYLHFPDKRRGAFLLTISPTARFQPDARPLAPAGLWKLSFCRLGRLDKPVHAWVQRDDSIRGYPQRGRQSRFEHPDYVRATEQSVPVHEDPPGYDGPVRRSSLISAIATGASAVVAGGYYERSGRLAPYSAGGPTTPAEPAARRKPDVLLPSDGSPAHPGMLAAGSRSGSVVAMSGTSVAAPQLARHLADRLAGGQPAGRDEVKLDAQGGNPGPLPQAGDRGGWGRLGRQGPRPVARLIPES